MKIAIIGANSQIGLEAIDLALTTTDAELNLFLRNASKLTDLNLPADRVTVFEGSADQKENLIPAIKGADYVFASLAGDMAAHAKAIIAAMDQVGVKRISFVTTLGIFDEVPGTFGKWNTANIGPYIPPYREASDLIEASDLDYTILRPAWLTNKKEVDYEITLRDEPFKGTEISRRSVAAVALEIAKNPSLYSHENIGIDKPGSDGDKPAFM
ncbi:NAD(P)H-binding protein [Streptococcus macacae]|nr:NAD(P)H-binding protein [Streptococcus macacae]SUN77651.1 NmrA-like dehydrogenase/reductase [Streptococcus macacae NCTC 11558]